MGLGLALAPSQSLVTITGGGSSVWVAQTCQEARQGSDGPTGLGDDSLALTHPDHWTCERCDTALGTLAQLGEGGHLFYDWHAQF